MPRDSAALLDIARAARLVIEFTNGMDHDAFLKDAKTQSAVLHQLLILGENAVDLSEVWSTAQRDVPDLLRYVESLPPDDEG